MIRCVRAVWLFSALLCSCAAPATSAKKGGSTSADWVTWQVQRRESVAGTNGWTTLAGLHWLQEGSNFAGSDATNHAVLPLGRAAQNIGQFFRHGRGVRFEAAPGVFATVDGKPIQSVDLLSDKNGAPTKLQVGPLSFIVIERGERLGLRVRDPEAAARTRFRGLKYFAYDPAWRIDGRYQPFSERRTLRVADVVGGSQPLVSPGAVVFTYRGKEYRFDVVEEPGADEFFVMFHDLTAGSTTYAAGRFLYIAKPDATGRVVIDFNRAYSPPCAFTAFATCPLPPRQNWLPFSVAAGERLPESAPEPRTRSAH